MSIDLMYVDKPIELSTNSTKYVNLYNKMLQDLRAMDGYVEVTRYIIPSNPDSNRSAFAACMANWFLWKTGKIISLKARREEISISS